MEDFSVIIVGAGCCGLYLASHLDLTESASRGLLIEGSESLGGRMFTRDGMNYGAGILRRSDIRMRKWCEKLGVELSEYHPSYFLHVNRHQLFDEAVNISQWASGILATLCHLYKTNPPGSCETFEKWVRRVLPKEKSDLFLNILVYTDTFEQDVFETLSSYRFEQDIFLSDQSKCYSIKEQWPALIEAATQDASANGFSVSTNTIVECIDYDRDRQKIVMTLQDRDSGAIRHVRTKTALFAIPPEALRKVVFSSTIPIVVRKNIETLIYAAPPWPYLRAYFTFDNLDWLLAYQQRYAQGADLKEADSMATDSDLGYVIPIDNRTLMSAYCDGPRATRWFMINPRDWYHDPTDTLVRYASCWDVQSSRTAPPAWAQQMHDLLQRITGEPVPEFVSCSCMYWPGGIHITRPGMSALHNPKCFELDASGTTLGFANEAFSHSQGWTEGAAESAHDLLGFCGYNIHCYNIH